MELKNFIQPFTDFLIQFLCTTQRPNLLMCQKTSLIDVTYLWITPCEKMTAVKQNRPLAPIYLGVKPFLPKHYTLTHLRTYQVLMHKILVTTNWLLCTKCSSLHNGRDGCNKLTVCNIHTGILAYFNIKD